MLIYILKVLLIQLIGLGIYFAFLRNQKLFAYARKFLWTVIVSSFILPLISLPIFEKAQPSEVLNMLPQQIPVQEIAIAVAPQTYIGMHGVYWIVYSLIAITMLGRLFMAFWKLTNVKKRSRFQAPNLYFSREIEMPYSFLNGIFIPTDFQADDKLALIIAHENEHITRKHSWDKIIISTLVSVMWFNPLLRLFHKELEIVHEYQVDESVTAQFSLDDYLQSLLQSTIYLKRSPISLTHSFFSSPIKNRIIMLHKKATNTFMKRLMSISLLLCVVFSTVYMQGRTVQKLPVKLEHKKATLKDTIIKENPIDGTFEMIVTNEDGTTSRYIKSPEDIARVLLNASSEDSIITYIPEDDEWLLTVDKEDAQNKNSKKDTTFEDNGNGTYTMTYTLHNKEKIKSVVPAKTMLAFLNRSAAPHSKWSLGENNGLVLNTNIKKWRKEKSSNFEQILDMKYLNIEPMHDVGDGTFSIIDNNKGSIEIVNEQKSTPIKLSKEAQFSGGNDKLSHYIISQIQYPQEAKNEGMEAQIYIEFKVNEDGTVSNLRTRALETTIKRKSTPPKDEYLKKLLEKEALRVIKNMPKWEPAYQENGEAISMKYVLPVKFQLKQQ